MGLRDIKSVPHTWGHVVMFETALTNPEHPGHDDAKGQWRALLAMLALRNDDQVVRTESIAFDVGTDQRPKGSFLGVVSDERLLPRMSGNSWQTVHLLYARVERDEQRRTEVLVGMLSPSTIVAPARDFAGHAGLKHSWARLGLSDPLAGEAKLTPDQLEVCRLFVTELREALPEDGGAAANQISRLLDSYAQDLDRAWGRGSHRPVGEARRERSGGRRLRPLPGCQQRLGRTRALKSSPISRSGR